MRPFVCVKHDRSGYTEDGHCPQCRAEITGTVQWYGQSSCARCAQLDARVAELEAEVERLTDQLDTVQRRYVQMAANLEAAQKAVRRLMNQDAAVKRIEARAETAEAERDRLAAVVESQGRDHDPATCTLGGLCPWCEIARLAEALDRALDDVAIVVDLFGCCELLGDHSIAMDAEEANEARQALNRAFGRGKVLRDRTAMADSEEK